MSTLLRFSQVGFQHGERVLFAELDASIADDACIALAGPNGVGKTTLLRLAAGTLKPQSGEVLLRGKSLATLRQREIAQTVALVPQHVEIPFSFTVEQFVEQGRTPFLKRFSGLSAVDRRAVRGRLHPDAAHAGR